MVLHVEVIIYGDPLILPGVRFRHLIDKGLVFFGREVIAGEEVEHDFNLDDWIRARRFDQPVRIVSK